MRMIDADAVIDRYYAEWEYHCIKLDEDERAWLRQCIDQAPTIEAEPVVRCRDCQYATWAIWAQRYNCEKVRGLLTADNHFCAWGKRREDHGKD